jgi:hypothetical protein
MKLLSHIASIVLLMLITQLTQAEEGCGTCIFNGKDFAFSMTAPEGWVLDNKSGVSMGLHQIFYPTGQTFRSSPVFAYSRARTKTSNIATIDDQVAATVAEFKPTSPNIAVTFSESLELPNGRLAKIYYYTGDQWGNFEAAGYIEEKRTINFVVLSARNKVAFESSLDAFRSILRSYTFISDRVEIEKSANARSLDFDFTGRTPDLSGNIKVQVIEGVLPGIPVLFDRSQPEKIVLRPATSDEQSNDTRPVYRFEWQEDKTAMFYELHDPTQLQQLSERNAKDSATPEGKAFESKVVPNFFADGKVLQTCLPKKFIGDITAFVVIGESGNQEQVIVLPEGSVAQCIVKETKDRSYPAPSSRFVAKASLHVAE